MDPCACITCELQRLTNRVYAYRIWRKNRPMDRITEKLKRASGVAQRAALSIESEADKLIAREDAIAAKTKQAFAPHHAVLDGRNRELDQLETSLQILSNVDPLASSGDAGVVTPPSPSADVRPQ